MRALLLLLLVAAPLSAQKADTVRTTRTRSVPVVDSIITITVTKTDTVKVPPVPVDTVTPPVEPPPTGRDPFYFNSSEVACSATALLCDDFGDGEWYNKNCDQANASGGLGQSDGWCGTIYGIKPPAKAVCGNAGPRGSNCAASHGAMSGGDQGWMADHDLLRSVNDVYIRTYIKAQTGYRFGAEKVLTVNKRGGSGIWFGNLHFNCGAGSAGSTGRLQWQPTGSENGCRDLLTVSAGQWYYVEIHLNVTAGLLEAWADACGVDGRSCPATPTKRFTYTGYKFQSGQPGNIWLENWANPGSSGTRLVGNVVVDTKRIGF